MSTTTTQRIRIFDIPVGAAITVNGSETVALRSFNDYGHDTHTMVDCDPFEYGGQASTFYVNVHARVDVLPGYYAITDR